MPPEISSFISRLLERCLNIRSVWCMAQDAHRVAQDAMEPATVAPRWELLVFADQATLERLRKATDVHRTDVDLLVVVDGDRFENAWGQGRLSGSLVRWSWRPVRPAEAYYNESRWGDQNDGGVVRIRRRAILIWQSRDELSAAG
jgi:hypothetical protein